MRETEAASGWKLTEVYRMNQSVKALRSKALHYFQFGFWPAFVNKVNASKVSYGAGP